MKQLLAVIGIILGAASIAVLILQFLPSPATIREDFICGEE